MGQIICLQFSYSCPNLNLIGNKGQMDRYMQILFVRYACDFKNFKNRIRD